MHQGVSASSPSLSRDYSVYVMRQASRRSWRIGQTRPVKVVFISYRNTLQADALKLVAKKLQSSLAVDGELPEDGLAAFGDDGDDLMMALARKIVSARRMTRRRSSRSSRRRGAEANAEELLVDDGWKSVEVEPDAVGVNGIGTNGHGGAIDIGPTVELVPGNGHHANGNGHAPVRSTAKGTTTRPRSRSSRCSPARSFLSRNLRSRKDADRGQKPASASLFKWALTLEWEKELVRVRS